MESRSRPRSRFQPNSTALPLDGLLAEREPKPASGVFFAAQALERLEYAALECRVYAGTVVRNGEFPIQFHPSG